MTFNRKVYLSCQIRTKYFFFQQSKEKIRTLVPVSSFSDDVTLFWLRAILFVLVFVRERILIMNYTIIDHYNQYIILRLWSWRSSMCIFGTIYLCIILLLARDGFSHVHLCMVIRELFNNYRYCYLIQALMRENKMTTESVHSRFSLRKASENTATSKCPRCFHPAEAVKWAGIKRCRKKEIWLHRSLPNWHKIKEILTYIISENY